MNPVRLNITAGSLPLGFCFTTPQALVNQFAQSISVTWPVNYSLFNFGPTKPAAGNQDKPWLRTLTNGTEDGWYVFSNGSWKRPHPLPPGIVTIYVDPSGNFQTNAAQTSFPAFYDSYDGGSAGAVTQTSGPFWSLQVPARGGNLYGRFPWAVDQAPGNTAFPVGKFGPQANDVEGIQAGTGAITNVPYLVVPFIYRTARLYYEIL